MKQKSLWVFSLVLITFMWLSINTTALYGRQLKEPSGTGEFLAWNHYTVPPTIYDVAFEGNFVWAATQNGVIRWNRNDHTYLTFTTADGLADNFVLSVAVDTAGNKWFGTANGGLSKYDGLNWTTYNTDDGLPYHRVPVITLHPNGNLLIGAGSSVVVFNGSSFSGLPVGGPTAAVTAITVDNSQNIWVGTADFGSFKLSGNHWQHYGDPDIGPGGRVRDIAVTPSGDVWFAFDSSFNGSVGRFSGNTWTRYSIADGLVDDYARSLDVDIYGQVWVGFHGGVAVFANNSWVQVNTGLPYVSGVEKVRADALGQVWFAIDNRLVSFTGNSWDIYLSGLPILPLLNPPKIGIAPNGDVWFGIYRSGVVRYDGNTWRMYTTLHGLAGPSVEDIAVDQSGNVWFATWIETWSAFGNGVSRFDGTNWSHFNYTNGLPNDAVYSIAVDGNNNVWFATHDGLAKYDGTNWQTYKTEDGLAVNRLQTVVAHGTDIWVVYNIFATIAVGHFDGITWTNYTLDNGLPDGVYAIDFDDSGDPWFAMPGKIAHFDGDIWTTYPYTIEPSATNMSGLVVDYTGDVWAGVYGGNELTGISRFSNGIWTNYTTEQGMLDNQVSDIAINQARTNIWFSMADQGVTQLVHLTGLDEAVYLPLVQKR